MKRILLAAGIAASCLSSAQVDPNRVVAVVNGQEIRGAEYYRRMEHLPNVGRMLGEEFAEAPPGLLTLQRLIEEKLVLQLAREKNCYPTDAELAEEKRLRLESNPDLMTQLSAAGLTQSDFDQQVLLDYAQFKLQTRGITVTNQEVDTFYNQNKTMFTTPKRFKLRLIVSDKAEDRAKVDEELKNGVPFAEVAAKYSQDVSKYRGGDIGMLPEGALSDEAKAALGSVEAGKTTEWLGRDQSRFKFLVEEILPEKLEELNDTIRVVIRRRLMLDRGRIQHNVQKELQEAWANLKLDVRQKEFEEPLRAIIRANSG